MATASEKQIWIFFLIYKLMNLRHHFCFCCYWQVLFISSCHMYLLSLSISYFLASVAMAVVRMICEKESENLFLTFIINVKEFDKNIELLLLEAWFYLLTPIPRVDLIVESFHLLPEYFGQFRFLYMNSPWTCSTQKRK